MIPSAPISSRRGIKSRTIARSTMISTRFLPNLQKRRFWVESENRWISLRLTNAALRTIDKTGIDAVLADLRAQGQHL